MFLNTKSLIILLNVLKLLKQRYYTSFRQKNEIEKKNKQMKRIFYKLHNIYASKFNEINGLPMDKFEVHNKSYFENQIWGTLFSKFFYKKHRRSIPFFRQKLSPQKYDVF